ncbi:LysR family transcriptional regulator [Paenibacillus sp. P96]|uniref:LysR family transcriptional regulator n=1 Tax=Paenibacillus zeirhizosphaerae TaxID=2987519 RepID=A0ABT9FW89_9BACL|nr:LysR family transcriptional regulator [Paenibacillus sp. P96]MDP4098757.1 LysR family transcriptional regulator [Paenibacillus sp. P96]
MTLQQLRYAIEIASCGSMSEAAKRLFISQPSLSNAIKELENELGISIFERTNRGISISVEGMEFLGYARQMIEQADFIENRYSGKQHSKIRFAVSTQHYAFAVDAFVRLTKQSELSDYSFHLRETQTYEIVDDVRTLRSDVGILYMSERNSKVLNKLFSDGSLKFTPLFNTHPHVFIRDGHPLSGRESISLNEISSYPFISFEQGDNNSLHFAEEMLSAARIDKSIKVNDRATLSNLLTGTDAYTIGTGLLASELNGSAVIALPVENGEMFTVGWIAHKERRPSQIAAAYIELLNDLVSGYFFNTNHFLL